MLRRGRPASSHYFIGAQRSPDGQGSSFFYLDPHHTRPAFPYHENLQNYCAADVDTCHTRRLRCLHVSEMDPSMLIGFLIMDEDDFEAWKLSVKHVQGKPIINVAEYDPARGMAAVRDEAIAEVEALSDDDETI